MVQNFAEGKEDVRSLNAEQGCSHTKHLIVGNSNPTGLLRHSAALSFIAFFIAPLRVVSKMLTTVVQIKNLIGTPKICDIF